MSNPLRHGSRRAAWRIVISYVVLSTLWILLSDRALGWLVEDRESLTTLATLKGWAFVAVSATFLFVLLRKTLGQVVEAAEARSRAEAAQRSSEGMLRSYLDHTPMAVVVADDQGVIRDGNQAVADLMGVPREEILGRHVAELHPPEERPAVRQALERLQRDGYTEQNFHLLGAGGRNVLGKVRAVKLGNGWSMGYIQDISDQAAAERTREENRRLMTHQAQIARTLPGALYSFRLGADNSFSLPYSSAPLEEFLGHSEAELAVDAGLLFAEIPAEERSAVQDSIFESARRLEPWRREFRVRHPRKGEIWLTGHSIPVREPDGATVWHGFLTDITERKRMEQALLERETQLRAIGDNLPDSYVYHYTHDEAGKPRFLYLSAGAEVLHQVKVEAVLADAAMLRGQIDPAQLDRLAELEAESRRNLADFSQELLIKRPDGTQRWLRVRSRPRLQADGRIVWDGVAMDVTDRKQMLDSLQLFRRLVDQADDSFEVFDTATARLIDCNQQECDELGYTRDELLRMHVWDIDPAASLEGWHKFTAQLREQGPVRDETTHRRKDGSLFPVEYNARVVRLDREYLVADVRNITGRKRAQEALRESEAKFALAFANNPAAILITRMADGQVVEVNDTWVRMWGYTREEIIGRSARFMWSAPEAAALFLQELRQHGVVHGWESEFRIKSGEMIPVQLWASVLELDGVPSVLTTLVDVRERQAAERALRQHRRILEETGRIAKVGGWSFDTTTGRGTWTDEVARIHDLDPTAPTSREIGLSFYTEKSRPRIEAALKAAVEQGVSYDLELELVSAKGVRKWVRTIGHPEMEQGRVVRVHGSFQDITGHKRTERQLRAQAAVGRVLSMAGSREEAIQGVLQAICEAKSLQFGAFWSPDEGDGRLRCEAVWTQPGMNLAEMVEDTRRRSFAPGEGLPGTVWRDRQVHVFPEVATEPNYLRREVAGRCGLHSALAFPVMIDGRVASVVDFLTVDPREADAALIDAFESLGHQIGLFLQRLRAEERVRTLNAELEQRVAARTAELEAANRELESFSYSVSHDLRSPLRVVDGYSKVLVEDHGPRLEPEARRYLETIRDGARRMGLLIDDLLAFSRLGRQPLNRQTVRMGELVSVVLAELEHERAGRQVTVTVGPLPEIQGDPTLLRQVWLNLIANAFKYTRRREVATIEISCANRGGCRVFSIYDNGAGFDMRYAEKLFGVFQRLHRAEDYEGTGVGLAIVQRIVQRHGGRVWAEAAVDRGATFHFTLEPSP